MNTIALSFQSARRMDVAWRACGRYIAYLCPCRVQLPVNVNVHSDVILDRNCYSNYPQIAPSDACQAEMLEIAVEFVLNRLHSSPK